MIRASALPPRARRVAYTVVLLEVSVLIGFAIVYRPFDLNRVTYISNQSLEAAAARVLGGVGHVGIWYLAVEVIVGVLGLAVAASLARRDDWLGAAAVTGTTGLLISPVSWTHHWVWIMPALIVLLRGGGAWPPPGTHRPAQPLRTRVPSTTYRPTPNRIGRRPTAAHPNAPIELWLVVRVLATYANDIS